MPGRVRKINFFVDKKLLVDTRMTLENYLERVVYVNVQVNCLWICNRFLISTMRLIILKSFFFFKFDEFKNDSRYFHR